jgi:hypothetical protein
VPLPPSLGSRQAHRLGVLFSTTILSLSTQSGDGDCTGSVLVPDGYFTFGWSGLAFDNAKYGYYAITGGIGPTQMTAANSGPGVAPPSSRRPRSSQIGLPSQNPTGRGHHRVPDDFDAHV